MSLTAEEAVRLVSANNKTTFNCPHCGHEHDGLEEGNCQELVTYHGDENPVEFHCQGQDCGCVFAVNETVQRSFEAAKSVNDFD